MIYNNNLSLNASLESDQSSCDELDIFFKEALKDIITGSDRIVCALNMLFSFIAVFANILILYALCKASSLHSSSKALLCSLALSDLGVGAVVQPLFVAYRWAQIKGDLPEFCTAGIISHIEGSHLSAVSFLTMTAISVDRLLALVLRVHYHSIVTLKRVLVILLVIWISGGAWASLWIINQRFYSVISIILIPVCFLIALFSYIKIYLCLRRQVIQLGTHAQPMTSIDTHKVEATPSQIRYRKSVLSMFYLFCAFILSYVPYLAHKILVGILGWCTSMSVLFSYGLTFVYANSSLNPVIYCWRIPEIKRLVMDIFCAAKTAIWSSMSHLKPTKRNRIEISTVKTLKS